MNQLKRAEVKMLPTSQKPVKGTLLFRNAFGQTSLWQYKETFTYKDGTEVYRTLGGSFEDWSVGMLPQHLYVIIKEYVKKGDWFIWKNNNAINQAKTDLDIINTHIEKGDVKKIIATTDTSLKIPYNNGDMNDLIIMPQPSEEFLQRYVESFKKELIVDILVEYDNLGKNCNCNGSIHDGCEYLEDKIELKINTKNNTIITKRLKNNYTRSEHILNLMNCVSELAAQFGHTPTASEMKKWNDATNKWAHDNL